MLKIQLNTVSKKFQNEWIFKNIQLEIAPFETLVIKGNNGSGKSTLLQIIAGFVSPTKGTVLHFIENKPIENEKMFSHIAIASPYLQLIEDFTILELANHCNKFKPFENNISAKDFTELIELKHAANKQIKQLSSGMKQRVKLGLAIYSKAPLLLLDEPLSNLDFNGGEWYKRQIKNVLNKKTIIVCSNQIEDEYFFCNKSLLISEYK
ncbi:MAG: ATP-binding cassette domain-containing protein [Bacteroidetes bacterium]|nr:ATP-binding cassette domain-containing protein [Bacteroidota bacterium]